jgi:hypothetical protein
MISVATNEVEHFFVSIQKSVQLCHSLRYALAVGVHHQFLADVACARPVAVTRSSLGNASSLQLAHAAAVFCCWLVLLVSVTQILALPVMQGHSVSYSSSTYSLQLPAGSAQQCGLRGVVTDGGKIRCGMTLLLPLIFHLVEPGIAGPAWDTSD